MDVSSVLCPRSAGTGDPLNLCIFSPHARPLVASRLDSGLAAGKHVENENHRALPTLPGEQKPGGMATRDNRSTRAKPMCAAGISTTARAALEKSQPPRPISSAVAQRVRQKRKDRSRLPPRAPIKLDCSRAAFVSLRLVAVRQVGRARTSARFDAHGGKTRHTILLPMFMSSIGGGSPERDRQLCGQPRCQGFWSQPHARGQ